MKRIGWIMMLSVTLSAGMCVGNQTVVTNDFCLINSPLMPKDRAMSDYIVDNDAVLARGLVSYNNYGEQECGWEF